MLFIKANSRHSDTPEAFKRIVSHDGVDGHKKLQYYKWLINVCLCVMHRKQRVICLIRWWRLDGWWTTQPRGHHNKHVQEIWKTENNIFSCFISDCNKIRVCCRWYRNWRRPTVTSSVLMSSMSSMNISWALLFSGCNSNLLGYSFA